MKLLLDTHVWLWSVLHPERLSRAVVREIRNSKNEVYLSPVSIWEAAHLHRKRRLRLEGGFSVWLEGTLQKAPLREAPFTFTVAAQAAAIELPQSDVGDVLLAATALIFGLTLVTCDEQLLSCSWIKTISNN